MLDPGKVIYAVQIVTKTSFCRTIEMMNWKENECLIQKSLPKRCAQVEVFMRLHYF
jgi:hypothetical protein